MAKYKNGQYGIEVRVPHLLANTDKEALVGSVLKDFAGECYEEYRNDLDSNGTPYKVYKATYNGSGLDLAHYQDLWNYNVLKHHEYHIGHHYYVLFGVKIFPGETLLYDMIYQDELTQQYYPTDPYEEPGQSQCGIDYARTIMREVSLKDEKVRYYPMLIELGKKYLYTLDDVQQRVHFNTEGEARDFLKRYDK